MPPSAGAHRLCLPCSPLQETRLLRPTRNLTALGIVAVFATLLAFGAGTATTEPAAIERQRAEVASIQSELDSINVQVEVAAEAYNGARYQLQEVNGRIDENTATTKQTEKDLRASRVALAQRLRGLYATPQPSLAEVLITSGSIAAASDQMDLLDRVGSQDAEVVGGLREHRVSLAKLRAQLVEDRQAAATAVEAREREQQRVQSLLSQREAVLDSASNELQGLIKAEEQRKRAEAAAQAALARQRAAAAAAAATAVTPSATPSAAPAATPSAAPAATPSAAPAATPSADPAAAAPSTPLPSSSGNAAAASIAMRYLGVPYVWGGASPSGFDCSGLASYAYAQIGKSVPHYTVAIYNAFPKVSSSELQPGDLVFWRGLGHMGIYIGGGQYVHAPQTGDVVKVSSMGDRSDFAGAVRP